MPNQIMVISKNCQHRNHRGNNRSMCDNHSRGNSKSYDSSSSSSSNSSSGGSSSSRSKVGVVVGLGVVVVVEVVVVAAVVLGSWAQPSHPDLGRLGS